MSTRMTQKLFKKKLTMFPFALGHIVCLLLVFFNYLCIQKGFFTILKSQLKLTLLFWTLFKHHCYTNEFKSICQFQILWSQNTPNVLFCNRKCTFPAFSFILVGSGTLNFSFAGFANEPLIVLQGQFFLVKLFELKWFSRKILWQMKLF